MRRGTCNTCAFFHDVRRECRFNPPTLVVKRLESIPPHFKPAASPAYASKWPTVDADDWCSHWKNALVGGRRKTYPHQLNDGDVAEENE